ncbi:Bro-N domain-containing protein [Azomonas macrocytogenes]|uniref:Prophage antirepressor-like protein n=1 Tax=Azomonas macrocytogenes TaxID=69962 RepID=A0A839T3V8_AZOMA|nr:BRO family protein [Azomonas macrocytogenes]MBB3103778.1 prophage antirepressor-like protein [Azomonas macrocytogenes]
MQTAQVIPFQFEALEVRTLLIDDQPWFCAADVCAVLGYAKG